MILQDTFYYCHQEWLPSRVALTALKFTHSLPEQLDDFSLISIDLN